MSNIIAHRQAVNHDVRPFMLEDVTFAMEARRKPSQLTANVIRGAEVDERDIQPFALYALAANSDATSTPLPDPAPPSPVVPPPGPSLGTAAAERLPDLPICAEAVPQMPVEELASAATRAAAEAAAQAVAGAVASLTRERERLIQSAQEEAAHCLAEAQAQTTLLSEEAYQQGFQQGEERARQDIAAQLAPILQTFQQAAVELAGLRASVLQQAETDVIDLAFQLARKIIAHEVLEHQHVLRATLARALAQVADQDRLIIRVHPEDLAQATMLQQDLLQALGEVKTVSLQADQAVGRGGCLVETALGTIDARIEAQIEELEHRFRGQHLLDMQARVA
ncbi:MAG: FliH/SctL family protein [Candidatus Tectimicrobiota bacterium]